MAIRLPASLTGLDASTPQVVATIVLAVHTRPKILSSHLACAALHSGGTTCSPGRQIVTYALSRVVYLAYFHPLSQFPGPRLAAVSNTWYAYHWLSGRWPWAVEAVLQEYGDVVRIAPNELVFFTPQAFTDIYTPHSKGLETFVKTDFQNRGKDLGGIIWEEDPVRHRTIAKKISPAFSPRAVRAMESVVHEYFDFFVEKMKELGSAWEGVELVDWTNWVASDLATDLTWNEQVSEMRNMKSSQYLEVMLAFNSFATVMQVFKRFPLLRPVQYLFAPVSKLWAFASMEEGTRQAVRRRIERRGSTTHVDFFDYVLPPAGQSMPTTPSRRDLTIMGSLGLQLSFAAWGPVSDWFYGAIWFLLLEPNAYQELVGEIRAKFQSYDEIVPAALTDRNLPYLRACLEESLRMLPSNNTGLPRRSPGAVVDGRYIPQGTHCQSSLFALTRSPRFFHDPMQFRPQRWLPPSHPLYEPVYRKDHTKGLPVFSLGTRVCLGREMAWMEGKLFMAKVLWTFDVLRVPGQEQDLERDLLHYGFLAKPGLKVRFTPVHR